MILIYDQRVMWPAKWLRAKLESEEYQWYRPIRVKEARFIKKCITDWEAEHLLRFSYFSYINRAMMAIRMIKILKAYCLE